MILLSLHDPPPPCDPTPVKCSISCFYSRYMLLLPLLLVLPLHHHPFLFAPSSVSCSSSPSFSKSCYILFIPILLLLPFHHPPLSPAPAPVTCSASPPAPNPVTCLPSPFCSFSYYSFLLLFLLACSYSGYMLFLPLLLLL